MIRLDVAQGSAAWFAARIGIPTASQFSKIITPKTGKLSESSRPYMCQLLAEYLLGEPIQDEGFDFSDRGTEMEAGARAFYELQREVDVEQVGFLMTDDRRAGCSPDGLVGEGGGLELKVPSAPVHVGYLLDGAGDKYRCQIQGALWITGREWWDFLSYHPTLPPALVRVHRDDVFIKALANAVNEFSDRLAAAKEELAARGVHPPEPVMTAPSVDLFFRVG